MLWHAHSPLGTFQTHMGSISQLLRTTGCGLMVRFPTSQTSGPEGCLRVRITLILKTTCSYEESQREAWSAEGFLELEFPLANMEREELWGGEELARGVKS